MSNYRRISFIVFVLVGGAISFGYWSVSEFDTAFQNIDQSLASTHEAYDFLKQRNEEKIIQTEPEEVAATSTNIELSFIFPEKGANLYIGCTYDLNFISSSTISYIDATLFDAGNKKEIIDSSSGLNEENNIQKDFQNIKWKVGAVWPGEYYIQTSKINGSDIQTKSEIFLINRMPEDIDVPAQKEICKNSNGSF